MSNEEIYFDGDSLALDVWRSKYQHNNESLDEFFLRIASEFARLDNFKNIDTYSKEVELLSNYGKSRIGEDRFDWFLKLFKNFKYIVPGGSVLSGVGSDKPISLSNCFVVKTDDSVGPIFDAAKDMAEIYKRRGGVGVDLSILRPNGAPVNNASKTTSGIVPFMELYSQVTNTIGQAGRRGALMLSVDINHPDSPDFIKIKQDLSRVTGANVSVKLNDEFMQAVQNDEDYLLRWPCNLDISDIVLQNEEYNILEELIVLNDIVKNPKPYGYIKRIKAKELWESIIHCAWSTAEPGILFWDNIINNDPASVYPQFRAVSTNPCGEIPLSPYDSCRLIATNLYSLVDEPFSKEANINYNDAYAIFYEAQIIGDILVDLEAEAVQRIIDITSGSEQELWQKIKQIGLDGRRTGVGLLGLADMLAALGKDYFNYATIEKIMKIKMEAELDATIDLAIINRPFPAYSISNEWDNVQETDIEPTIGTNQFYEFFRVTFPEQFQRMIQWGRRNISFSTIAPTGTISILAGTSSGCEPVFSLYYTRRKKCNPGEVADFTDQNGIGFKNYNVVHGKFKTWAKINFNIEEDALASLHEAELQTLIKKSPWYGNTAEDIDAIDRVKVQSILQKYTTHSISSTVNVSQDTTEETIATIYNTAYELGCKGITVYRDGSRSGILVKTENSTTFPEVRPSEIKCKVAQFKNEKKEWVAFVGLINNKPYEIFTGPKDLEVFPIPSSITEGYIIKIKEADNTSRYDFKYIDSYGYTNILGGLSRIFDKEYWNYARFVSALLRQETPMEQVVKVVEGLSFTNKGMNSWKSGLIRSLKLFISDGTKALGATCENCNSNGNIVYEGGCMICKDCGSSHCN